MRFFKKVALLSLVATGSAFGMSGCSMKSNVKLPVTFVAVTSNTYDADVQFGDFSYKFKGKVEANGVFTLEAKAQERVKAGGSGQGGPGGGNWGGWDGGGQGGGQGQTPQPGDPDYVAVTSIRIVEKQQSGGGPGGGGMPPFSTGRPGPGPQQAADVEEVELEAGKDTTVDVEITPSNASNTKVKWESSNPQVATVSDGKITAVNKGTATITATSEDNPNAKDTVAVTVTKVDVTSITLDKASEEVFINETKALTATIAPENASIKDIEWTTSDESIATVSSGSVTGVSEGTVTITAKAKDNPAILATAEVKVNVENMREHDWEIKGTYTVDAYGYTLTFKNDGNEANGKDTVLHVDFNKTEGRHEFYYNVNINDTQKLVKFQAKDPTFKDQLAKDYKTWDERDSDYIFRAKATGNNNSVATAYLYLHKDGTAVLNAPSGTEREITIGLSWKFENETFEVKKGNGVYTSIKSKNALKPGFALPLDNYTFILSTNPDVRWKKMDVTDFVGAAQQTYTGSYIDNTPDKRKTEFALYILEGNKALVYSGWTQCCKGDATITPDNNGEFKLSYVYVKDGQEVQYESTSTNGGKNIKVKGAFKVSRGPNISWEEIECEVTLVE